MSANLTFDQVGLPAGTLNESREDGLATGAVMSVTVSGHVSTHRAELLWAGQHGTPDTTSNASFAPSGPNTYSWTPTVGAIGTWLVNVVTDENTADQDELTLAFSVKSSPTALRIPAPQERGDPLASLQNATAEQKRASWFNKPELTGPFSGAGGTWAPWWRPTADLIHLINQVGGVPVPPTRLINTTAPLTGGGDLSMDRTHAITAATTIAAGSMSAADKAKLDAMQNAVAFVAVAGTSKTFGLSDAYTAQECTNGSPVALTVPPNSDVAFEIGTVISAIQEGAGQLTLTPGVGVTLNSSGAELKTPRQWAEIFMTKNGTNSWIITGEKST